MHAILTSLDHPICHLANLNSDEDEAISLGLGCGDSTLINPSLCKTPRIKVDLTKCKPHPEIPMNAFLLSKHSLQVKSPASITAHLPI